jgi:hypothetical protein
MSSDKRSIDCLRSKWEEQAVNAPGEVPENALHSEGEVDINTTMALNPSWLVYTVHTSLPDRKRWRRDKCLRVAGLLGSSLHRWSWEK